MKSNFRTGTIPFTLFLDDLTGPGTCEVMFLFADSANPETIFCKKATLTFFFGL